MAVAQQRQGPKSRALWYPETTFDTDPGSPVGYVLPLAQQANVAQTQKRLPVEVFDGTRTPPGSVLGIIEQGGDAMLDMEFITIGNLLKSFFGANATSYIHTASTFLHQFSGLGDPGSGSLQFEFTDTASQFLRGRGIKINKLSFKYDVQGASKYTVSFLGIGDTPNTDEAGTKTANAFSAVSYFNGQLLLGGVSNTSVVGFEFNAENQITRSEAAWNGGVAGSLVAGQQKYGGKLTLLFDTTANLTQFNQAINDTPLSLEWEWADQGGSSLQSATKWYRCICPYIKLARPAINPGGNAGLVQAFDFTVEMDAVNGGRAGEFIAGTGATTGVKAGAGYVITTGVNNQIGIKVDGGATLTKVIPQATYPTAAALAAAIPATAGATIDSYNGYLRITSNTKGAASSIQLDVATTTNCYATIGAHTTINSGQAPNPFFSDLVTSQTAAY